MEKLSREHFNALRNVMRGTEQGDQVMKANEALDIIDAMTKKTDVQIAAENQGLKKAEVLECWINNEGEMFHWTPKGFKIIGTLTAEHWDKLTQHVPDGYCKCPYPREERFSRYKICGKCGNQLL